jgi:alkylated DNA nucleotide flippase Atl1
VAKLAGVASARAVGNWLHRNPYPGTVPCHRVVNRQGKLARNFGAKGKIKTQAKRLKQEGVKISNNRVDLNQYLWRA